MAELVYIGRPKGSVVHLWLERAGDTACSQWSTGGIRAKGSFVRLPSAAGRKVCHMCNQFTHELDDRIRQLNARRHARRRCEAVDGLAVERKQAADAPLAPAATDVANKPQKRSQGGLEPSVGSSPRASPWAGRWKKPAGTMADYIERMKRLDESRSPLLRAAGREGGDP